MSHFFQTLERSKLNQELIGFWKYNESDSFWCGYVIDYNETLVQFQHFTKYGKSDGIIIFRVSEIKNIDFDDEYLKALQVVVDYSKELYKEEKTNLMLSGNEDWDYEIIKQLEGNFDVITSVELSGSEFFSGYILSVNEEDFIISCVGKLGEDEGKCICKIVDIIGFRVNDIEDRKRAMLYKWRKASL